MASYDNPDSYEIPFKLLTRKGAQIFGELVRKWAIEGAPKEAQLHDRSATLNRGDFTTHLNALGLQEDLDYRIRSGVESFELYSRQTNTASFLMPEADSITRFEEPGKHQIDIPTQYLNVLLNPQIGGYLQTSNANYPYQIDSDGYKEFLDPFMASYMCMQCA
jgi:hypothetical protein